MTDGTFEKVRRSDNPMYGSRKLLLCGFSAAAQPKVAAVLQMAGLADIDLLWANPGHARQPLAELLDLPAGDGAGQDSTLPRAIIVSGGN